MISFSSFLDESMRRPDGFDAVVDQLRSTQYGFHNQALEAMKHIAEKHGFKILGRGGYGIVFGHPTYPYVVKVFLGDRAYLKWTHFVQANKGNIHVPIIKGSAKILAVNGKGEVIHAIRLEKLNPMNPDEFGEFDEEMDWVRSHPEVNPDLWKILQWVDKEPYKDWHYGNVMFRPGTNDYVVTDPVA